MSTVTTAKTLKQEMMRISREYHSVLLTEQNARENKVEILAEAAMTQASAAGVRVNHFIELLCGENGWGYVVTEITPVLLKAPEGPHDLMDVTWRAECDLVNSDDLVPAAVTIFPGGSCGGTDLEGSKIRHKYKWVPVV